MNSRKWNDISIFHENPVNLSSPITLLKSLDDLLKKDQDREQDGFPRKIQIGRMLKPTKGGNKIVVVPTLEESKLLHDQIRIPQQSQSDDPGEEGGGAGEGEEGEKIGETPAHEPGQSGDGAGEGGEGEGAHHEIEASAYELGKMLTEKFELPNITTKGKKVLSHYTFELTDKNTGTGQLLDKKHTLKKVIETNLNLGRIDPFTAKFDPSQLLVAPRDKVFRILSREKEYESQALVFFVRDYSGSMWGLNTEIVVQTHILIYSWLTYQYQNRVETRFILHDTKAKEVSDFHEYHKSRAAGGTKIAPAWELIDDIVRKGGLARDYNIYIFYGTDGDDSDREGKSTLPAIRKCLNFTNRAGITLSGSRNRMSSFENYLEELLRTQKKYLRLDRISEKPDENRLVEGIKYLTEEEKHATA